MIERTDPSPRKPGSTDQVRDGDGFIAMVSAIIISIMLLAITLAITFNAYFARFNVLDSESKERSVGLAEACADTAVADLAQSITPPATLPVGADSCSIVSVQKNIPASGQDTIQTQAIINRAYTNLQIVIKDSDLSVISWLELPHF